MAKSDFLLNLRVARNLFAPRVQTGEFRSDSSHMGIRLDRAALWLTPSSVKGFDVREFPELAPDVRDQLKANVERFLRVARSVPRSKPATDQQFREGSESLESVLEVLVSYLPIPREEKQIREILDSIRFPDYVVGYNYEIGEDWSGDPAVWVWVVIEDEAAERDDILGRISSEFEREIREKLGDVGSSRWPYVRIRSASEQRVA